MQDYITGIQQIGIGVTDAEKAKFLYRDLFGMAAKIFDDKSPATLMTPYTGGDIHDRHAILTMNLSCGGGFEIWQFTSREPTQQPNISIGDLGIFAAKIRTNNIDAAHLFYAANKLIKTSAIQKTPGQASYFWVLDPYGNHYQIVDCAQTYMNNAFVCGGVCGAVIGVSNMDNAIAFYSEVLGIHQKIHETICTEVVFGKEVRLKKVLLQKNKNTAGAFANLLGNIQIELVQALDVQPDKIFNNRFWGDCGFIHLCFDVLNMKQLKERSERQGYTFSIDSEGSFEMESAAGRFCYVEDPDGTLIELVETHKIPILKKWGWFINLKKEKYSKPLPKWMIGMLGLSKV